MALAPPCDTNGFFCGRNCLNFCLHSPLSRAHGGRGRSASVFFFCNSLSMYERGERTDRRVSITIIKRAGEMLFSRVPFCAWCIRRVLSARYNTMGWDFPFPASSSSVAAADLIRHPRLDFVFRRVGGRRLTGRIKIQTEWDCHLRRVLWECSRAFIHAESFQSSLINFLQHGKRQMVFSP